MKAFSVRVFCPSITVQLLLFKWKILNILLTNCIWHLEIITCSYC